MISSVLVHQHRHRRIIKSSAIQSANREVSLHVKRERVRVTSHLGAQFRYTSRSRTLIGFASHDDVSTEKEGHRYQQMKDNSPLNALVNKNQCTLHNDILEHGKEDYRQQLAVIVSSGFVSHWDVHITPLRELFDYTLKSRRVTCSLPWTMPQRTYILMTSRSSVPFYTYTFTFYV